MELTRSEKLKTKRFLITKQQRNVFWPMYTKDVIHRKLHRKISFWHYCKRILEKSQ